MKLTVGPVYQEVTLGTPVTVVAQVFNTDEVINAYAVRVYGVDAAWVRLDDDRLSLFPGAAGAVAVVVAVPPEYPAGVLRLGIEVTPLVNPTGREVGEVDIVVPPRRQGLLELDPQSFIGGRRGPFTVTLGNLGNAPIRLELAATDPEQAVTVAFDPPVIELLPKERVVIPALATAKRPLVGAPAARAITFSAAGGDTPLHAVGTFIQKPVVSRGMMSMLGLMAAVTVFAVVLTTILGRVASVSAVDESLLERAVQGKAIATDAASATTLGGRVSLLTSGAGAVGVTVELFATGDEATPLASTATGSDGAYQLTHVAAGKYKVRMRGAGFVDVWYADATAFADATEIEVQPGTPAGGIDAILGAVPGSIAGRVTAEDPSGATVTLQLPGAAIGSDTASELQSKVLDASGEFVLDNVPTPGSFQIVVTKPGWVSETRLVNLQAAEAKKGVELSLRRGDGAITGVVTAGGQPVGGVRITATSATGAATTVSLTGGDVGRFTFRNLPTPAQYTVSFEKEGYAGAFLSVDLGRGQARDDLAVALASGVGSIAGTVRGTDGSPLAGATVTVTDGTTTLVSRTLSQGTVGTYQVRDLPVPGTYTVTVTAPGHVAQAVAVHLLPHTAENVRGVDVRLPVAPPPTTTTTAPAAATTTTAPPAGTTTSTTTVGTGG